MASLGSDMAAGFPLELVENHLTSLRRLALLLVRDPNDAEDAVQETWLRALQSRPAGLHRLRGWLETVLRNVVRRRHRQQRRSQVRERSVARRDAVPPAVDVVVRQQHLASLTDAIRELPVELQECVFLRYFEGLPPRRIAERTGRPVARIYRSLERAKIQLRRSLEKRDQSWQTGLALLIGLRPAATTLAVGGWIVLSKKLAAVVGLSLVLLFSYVAGLWSDPEVEPDPVGSQAGATLKAGGRTEVGVQTAGKAAADARQEVPTAEDRDRSLAKLAPYEFELEVHARTEDDLPGAGVPILLAPEFHTLNRARTDDAGVLHIKFRGRQQTMTLVIASPRDLSSGLRLRRLKVAAGETARTVVRVRSARMRNGFIATPRYVMRITGSPHRETRMLSSSYGISPPGGGAPKLRRDADGLSWFTTGRAVVSAAAYDQFTRVKMAWGHSSVRRYSKLPKPAPSKADSASKRVLSGTVKDASGRPAAMALILAGDHRAMTNASGKFKLEFRAKDGDRVAVRAGGGDFGLAELALDIGDRKEFTWDPQLDRGIEFRGQLVDADGKPLGKWRIEIEPMDGEPWIDGTFTDKSGGFSIPNVKDRPYRLRAFAPRCVLSSFRRLGLHPHRQHVLPVVAPTKPGSFQVAPRDVHGKAVSRSEVRLWDDGTGEGRFVRVSKKPKPVAAGNYRLVIGAPGFATKDVTQVQVDSAQLLDLGSVDLGERTILELAAEAKDKKLQLYRLHPAVPTWVEIGKRRRFQLPPGRYRALKKRSELEFDVAPGENEMPRK